MFIQDYSILIVTVHLNPTVAKFMIGLLALEEYPWYVTHVLHVLIDLHTLVHDHSSHSKHNSEQVHIEQSKELTAIHLTHYIYYINVDAVICQVFLLR